MVSIQRFAWRAGLSALVVMLVATAADADSLTIKRKKGFFSSLFKSSAEQNAIKQRNAQRYQFKKSGKSWLFGSSWDQPGDPGVRIITGGASKKGKLKASGELDISLKRQAIGGVDPEATAGFGMGNLTYVPDKLVSLDGAALRSPKPAAGSIEAGIFDALGGHDLGLRLRTADRDAIIAYYDSFAFRPLWIVNGKPSERAILVLKTLAGANAEGLDAAAYLPAGFASFEDAQTIAENDLARLARLDIGLTAAALSYAHDASGGRFDPARLSLYHDIKPETVSPSVAMKVLAFSPYADSYLLGLQPKHPAYAAMKTALAEIHDRALGIKLIHIEPGTRVKPGKADPRLPLLRERLVQLGFAVVDGGLGSKPDVLDESVTAALKDFQAEHGMKATGQLDNATVNALNGNNDERNQQQLVDNMERLRWLPKDLGRRYIFVNQAGYQVDLIDSGKSIWTSRVIVGKPMTQTAVFNDQMETVVFNPSWGVPASIVTNEYLPKLRKDPGYLDRIGFTVVDTNGRKVSSRAVDWWSYSSNVPYGIQQPPGEKNALGELKFLFPNRHDIYMHDTPNRGLFNESVRAFSHGCVRVQNPREFASILLGWDRAKVDATTDSKESQSVRLPAKIPVHIAYFTAWPDESGKIKYFNDIYGRDESLEKAMSVTTIAAR